ncbi:MAG: protein kinase [Isosphaeraceae bacterium]|nr:protein kinase [Isosphaeraceae bacterium]
MADFDAETLAEQAVMIGLLTRAQVREAKDDAEDGSLEALTRALLRKGMLTSWQIEKLQKGEVQGFFYGGCKILFHIAEGTFARVYRGQRVQGGQSVAIKVLRQRFVADRHAIDTFNQEAENGLRLVHPNIVQTYEYGEQDKRHYMIMEYVEGMNLRDFLKIRHRLDAPAALPLMLGMARGLKYAHDQGVTHRDIKGTNILISNSGIAKLVDFGLATLRGESSKTAFAHGQRTVDYSALERTCGSPKGDPRSDIYFLGCVFYQMLTGVLPLPEVESSDPLAKMLKRSFGAIKPLGEHRYAPDEELTAIIEKMMKIDLKLRYQTIGEVVADLEAYQAQLADGSSAAKAAKKALAPEDELIAELFGRRAKEKAAPSKNVLCVEVQDQIQEAFRKVFTQMGYKVLLVRDAERAAERYRESPPDAVVFDADGLGPGAIDAFLDMHEKAQEDGRPLTALVLLGPRQKELTSQLPTDDRLVVLCKPLKMKDVQDAIAQLVPLH